MMGIHLVIEHKKNKIVQGIVRLRKEQKTPHEYIRCLNGYYGYNSLELFDPASILEETT